jgi:hypothetical protein
MQRIAAVLIMGGGLAFLASLYVPSATDREEQVAAMTRIVARATILEPETVPAELPGLRRPVTSPAAVATLPAMPAPTPTALAPVEIETRTALPPPAVAERPAGANIQRRLAREIQAELKRVGCYSGSLDGSWGERSRSAMATFISRVNASLPTTEPDVFLLSLIKGQSSTVCGPACGLNEEAIAGRCVANSVVATADDVTPPATAVPPARLKPAPVAPAPVVVAAARPAPLPGRMSIGGPLDSPSPRPPVTGDEPLPWHAAPARPPVDDVAALDPEEPRRRPDGSAPPPSRNTTKVKRTWTGSPPARPKPSKRRKSTTRQVQMLFMHPLGRM